jgi:hypothetical protein
MLGELAGRLGLHNAHLLVPTLVVAMLAAFAQKPPARALCSSLVLHREIPASPGKAHRAIWHGMAKTRQELTCVGSLLLAGGAKAADVFPPVTPETRQIATGDGLPAASAWRSSPGNGNARIPA